MVRDEDHPTEDAFDNGRTPEQLRTTFENSHATCIAYMNNRIVSTARVLSDGGCNAYIVDIWVLTKHRHQGIARHMMQLLLSKLKGQHVYFLQVALASFIENSGSVSSLSARGKS